MAERRYSDVGGRPGGLGHFVLGFVMTCLGSYWLANQVIIAGLRWNL
jgi:hypothetical protein